MTVPDSFGRRGALAAIGAGLFGTLAGCLEGPSFPDADVIAGPDGDLVFEPMELSVPAGETVRWGFASSGHNICCRPEDSSEVQLPHAAEPFASYGPEESPRQLVKQGDTYEHTFEITGEYIYVCIPHVGQGMIGTIHVG